MHGPALSGRPPKRALVRRPAWSWHVWFWLALALAVTGLHACSPPTALIGEWTYLAVGSGASVAAWIGSSRAAPDRVVGRLVALGVTLSATGDLVYQLLDWLALRRRTCPWPTSGGWVPTSRSRPPCCGCSASAATAGGAFRDGLVDVAVICVMVLLIEWEVSVGALVGDDSLPLFSRLVWTLYPACDALLIALVLRVVTTRQRVSAMPGPVRGRRTVLVGVGLRLPLVFVARCFDALDGHRLAAGCPAPGVLHLATIRPGVRRRGAGASDGARQHRPRAAATARARGDRRWSGGAMAPTPTRSR